MKNHFSEVDHWS